MIHETKSGLGFLTCRSCSTDYKITELHLKGIKECINHKCRIKTLEPKIPDTSIEYNSWISFGEEYKGSRYHHKINSNLY